MDEAEQVAFDEGYPDHTVLAPPVAGAMPSTAALVGACLGSPAPSAAPLPGVIVDAGPYGTAPSGIHPSRFAPSVVAAPVSTFPAASANEVENVDNAIRMVACPAALNFGTSVSSKLVIAATVQSTYPRLAFAKVGADIVYVAEDASTAGVDFGVTTVRSAAMTISVQKFGGLVTPSSRGGSTGRPNHAHCLHRDGRGVEKGLSHEFFPD